MEKNLLIVILGMMLLPLSGCASTMAIEKATAMATTATQDKFSFDVSTPGADTGKLIVHCRPPSNQMFVDRYAIAIDSNPPLVVTKESDTDIKLNAGEHTIKFYATFPDPKQSEKVAFGHLTKKVIVITKDTEQSLKYTGPWRLFGEGKVEINK
ncbi:MAG: hypothetical protein HQL25_07630 [Candidatus Omnitrophica bacterium]|nr:hypothetical protein [Candidatus Omnitrophota bacterium]